MTRKKYTNIEVWTAQAEGTSMGTDEFTLTITGRSKDSDTDHQVILKMDYYSFLKIVRETKEIIIKRSRSQMDNYDSLRKIVL